MTRLYALLLCALAASAQAGDLRLSDFAAGMTLSTPGAEALYEVALPYEVYGKAQRADLGDLRVFNAAGEVVPHAFMPVVRDRVEKRAPLAAPFFPLHGAGRQLDRVAIRLEQNGTIVNVGSAAQQAEQPLVGYLFDASAIDAPLQALMLDWPADAEGYSAQVRIEASDDLRMWRTIADAAPLLALDYAGQRLEQKRIALPAQRVKYLRLTWSGPAKPLTLTRAQVEPAETRADMPRSWQNAKAGAGKEAGEYMFDLEGAPPLDRLRVELPQSNTLVSAQLLTRAKPDDAWRVVYAGTFYQLVQNGQTLRNPDVEIAPCATRYWLLRVDTRGGGIGAQAPMLTAGWLPPRLVFVARGAGPFEIAYGSATIAPNGLSIANLVPGYKEREERKLPSALAGAPHALGGDARLSPAVDWKTRSLWIVLVLAVAALGAMAFRLLRQVGQADELKR